MNYQLTNVHVTDIVAGDTIILNGQMRTVCQKDIKSDPFWGRSIFGDCFRAGHQPVQRVDYIRAVAPALTERELNELHGV